MSALLHRTLVLTAFALTFSESTAQLGWRLVTTGNPTATHSFAIATDSARGQVLLFGGDKSILNALDETWTFDPNGWRKVTTTTSPTARVNTVMTFDSKRGTVLLFGGLDASFNVLNDTWSWNGATWTKLTPTTAPPARGYAAMAYDAVRDRVVLFGGVDSTFTALSDTWEWDGTNWTQRSPTAVPTARNGHSMVYDPARSRVLLFGGDTGNLAGLDDTWEWDGTNWIQRTTTSKPAPRYGQSMAWDPQRGRVMMLGGANNSRYHGDTWEWDGAQWLSRISTFPTAAPHFSGLAYAPHRAGLVHYGSVLSTTATLELFSQTPARATPYGAGCSGSNGVVALQPAPFSFPILGGTFRMDATNLPLTAGPTWLAVGVLQDNFDMTAIGAPGCTWLRSTDLVFGLARTSGAASLGVPIPNDNTLLGVITFWQVVAADATANSLGLTLSNGLNVGAGL